MVARLAICAALRTWLNVHIDFILTALGIYGHLDLKTKGNIVNILFVMNQNVNRQDNGSEAAFARNYFHCLRRGGRGPRSRTNVVELGPYGNRNNARTMLQPPSSSGRQ